MKRRNGPFRNLASLPTRERRNSEAVLSSDPSFGVLLALVSGFASGQTDASSSPGLPVDKYSSITAIPLLRTAPGDTSADPATMPFLTVFPPKDR